MNAKEIIPLFQDEEKRKNEAKYELLFNSMKHAVFLADVETGIILDCNKAATLLTGHSKEEIVGRHQSTLHPAHELEGKFSHTFHQHRHGQEGDIHEVQILCADGEIRDVSIHASFIVLDGRRLVQGIFRDMTQQKKIEEDLKKQRQLIDEMNRDIIAEKTVALTQAQAKLFQTTKLAMLGEMSTGMAHELNQPLYCISLVMQTMKKLSLMNSLTAEDIEQSFTDINDNIKRMTKIIQHVRTFARQETMTFAQVNVNETIESALTLFEAQLRLHEIEVKKDLANSLPKIEGERYQLEQVWINLFSNARDALDDLSKNKALNRTFKRLSISTKVEGDYILVEVTDNGIGMSEEVRQKVLDPFFTTKPPGKGTGLGLSIAFGIIEAHKGKIEVRSRQNEGTTIAVRIPTIAD